MTLPELLTSKLCSICHRMSHSFGIDGLAAMENMNSNLECRPENHYWDRQGWRWSNIGWENSKAQHTKQQSMFVDSKCWALRFESCSVGENVKRVTLFFYKEQNVLNLRRVHLGEWYSPTSQKIENRGRSLCETGLKCINVVGMDTRGTN